MCVFIAMSFVDSSLIHMIILSDTDSFVKAFNTTIFARFKGGGGREQIENIRIP